MRLIRAKNYDDMSLKAANIIAAQVSLNPKSVLGLATGSTPIGTYRHLVEWYQKGELDFGKAVSINLDEYCGLSGDHPQSYRRFMRENLFDHINIPADRSFLPDGTQTDSALSAPGMTGSSRSITASTCSCWASAATLTLASTSRTAALPAAPIR